MISFNIPPFVGDEMVYVEEAIKAKKISGDYACEYTARR